jgi:hypothetical protein
LWGGKERHPPASELDPRKIVEMLQKGGQAVSLAVERNGRPLKIKLELKERI